MRQVAMGADIADVRRGPSPLGRSTATESPRPGSAWVLTSGNAGHEVQCIGIAEALGLQPRILRVAPKPPWRWLAPWGPASPDPAVAPPWPDVLIVSGRQSIPYARAVRRRAHGRTFVAVMQDPAVPARWFDLVWVNEHDSLSGPNVVRTLTSPHRLTAERLASGAARLVARIGPLPRPWIGLIVGGRSAAYRFEPADGARLAADMAALAAKAGGSVIATPSRRTGADNEAVLRKGLAPAPHWLWDGTGENPYDGILGAADHLVVTCDSVNMLGEAAFTGKPIQAYPLDGGTPKLAAFHAALAARGTMRWFDGRLVPAEYDPPNATSVIAAAILDRYAASRRTQRR